MSNSLIVRLPKVPPEVSIRKDWFEERDKLISLANSYKLILSKADFERAGEILSALARASSILESMRGKLSRPLLEAARDLKLASDFAKAPIEAARRRLHSKLAAFAVAERRRAEEAWRLASLRRRAAIPEFESANSAAMRESGSVAVFSPPFPKMPRSSPPFLKARSVAVRRVISFEVLDPSKMPRQFLSPDRARINAWIDANREGLRRRLAKDPAFASRAIPGLAIRLDTQVVSR